jgi:hypothetical protein
MLVFEFIKSPDKDVMSIFQYFQNEIYIGRSSGNLLIKDPSLCESHLMVEVIGTDLIVHPQKNVNHYLIDGKRSTTVRKIKIGQVITIGKTDFKITHFEETIFRTKKTILDEKLTQLIEANSSRVEIVELLAKLMK